MLVGGVQVSCYGDFKYQALSHIAMSVARVLVDSIACMSLACRQLACRQLVLGNWRSAFRALMSQPPRLFVAEVNIDNSIWVQAARELLPWFFKKL